MLRSPPLRRLCIVCVQALLNGPREKDTLVALYAPWCQFCKVGGSAQATRCMPLSCCPVARPGPARLPAVGSLPATRC